MKLRRKYSIRDNHAPIWNTKRNHAAWKLYLKGITEVPPYAAPARQTDYFKAVAKKTIAKFEEQFCYAAEQYFAPQNKE